jgi:transposase, IS5 family
VAKKRKVSRNQLRKGLRKQLSYLRHNLQRIENYSGKTSLNALSKKQCRDLLVISELYRQPRIMYEQETHRSEGRTVSISQPHVRPIVREKAGTPVEFGAKFSVSVVDGYVFFEVVSWDNYHEANDLIDTIERYTQRFGYYPSSVHVDKIYRNRVNPKFCKAHEIRISCPPWVGLQRK